MLDPGWLTRPLIDAFIVAYLFVAWAWRHPVGTLGRIATEPLAGIVRWLGLGQDWSMFTPNPASHGVRLQVIIKRRSGAAIVWEPPQLEEGSAWRAFLLFRYRTYANAIMSTWAIAARSTLADYLLRKYDLSDDPATEVLYTWTEQPIAPPGESAAEAQPERSIFHVVSASGEPQ